MSTPSAGSCMSRSRDFQHRLQWFRHEVERTREKDLEFYLGLMNDVRKRIANGTAQPSMATLGLERQEEFGLSDLEMAYTLAGPWDAGVGTVRCRLGVDAECV